MIQLGTGLPKAVLLLQAKECHHPLFPRVSPVTHFSFPVLGTKHFTATLVKSAAAWVRLPLRAFQPYPRDINEGFSCPWQIGCSWTPGEIHLPTP